VPGARLCVLKPSGRHRSAGVRKPSVPGASLCVLKPGGLKPKSRISAGDPLPNSPDLCGRSTTKPPRSLREIHYRNDVPRSLLFRKKA
jgi:hypothetical protein